MAPQPHWAQLSILSSNILSLMMDLPILITAPENYAKRFSHALMAVNDSQFSFNVFSTPLVETITNPDLSALLSDINSYDYIAFTSRKAILALHEMGVQLPQSVGCCAIGKDNEALALLGAKPCLIANEPSPMGIVNGLNGLSGIKGKHIAVLGPRVEGLIEPDTVPDFIKALNDIGLVVDFIPAYITRCADEVTLDKVSALVSNAQVHCVAFTSATEAQAFHRALKNTPLPSSLRIACFGPYTAQCIRKEGFHVDFVSPDFSGFDNFARNLKDFFLR